MARLEGYEQEEQQERFWCWAAVACSVAAYRGRPGWRQCTIARRVLNRQSCCTQPESCDEMARLEDALAVTESFAGHEESHVDLDVIRTQIGFHCPVCIRIERDDGTAHLLVIVGYDTGEGDECELEVRDPWGAGQDFVRYGVLRRSWYSGGRWTDTYFTT